MPVFVLARTAGARPTLQHVCSTTNLNLTECGLDMTWWSRAFQQNAISQILCKKCGRKL